jgi:microcystin degradation protein MlrC
LGKTAQCRRPGSPAKRQPADDGAGCPACRRVAALTRPTCRRAARHRSPAIARIAVAGFQHETNTFAPKKADYAAFDTAAAFPPVLTGDAVLAETRGRNLPVAGFAAEAERLGHTLLPLVWAGAPPSAEVTDDAYARIANTLLERLADQVDLDAVYLDLHGAMVTESRQDGEGALLAQLRALVGDQLPVVCSLDLHANVSPEMAERASALISFRHYPHTDMADTGARAARHLDALLAGTAGSATAFRQLPFLLPLTAGCTLHEPGAGVYRRLAALEAETPGLLLSFNCGFPPADVRDAGPSVVAHASDAASAARAADALAAFVLDREAAFGADILAADAAVDRALELAAGAAGPVVLADTQDNPGAGGEGDTTGLLRALMNRDARGAVVGLLHDPDAAAAAHAAGVGAELPLVLGGRSPGDRPLQATARVEALAEGPVTGTGPFYKGAALATGAMALLRLNGQEIRVAVISRKMQAADQAPFRALGVEPAAQRLLVLKSSVHFRADFAPIAAAVLVAAAPGPNPVDHTQLAYHRLRAGVRLMPEGPTFLGPRG